MIHLWHRWKVVEYRFYPIKSDPFSVTKYRCRACGAERERFVSR